MSRKIGEGAKDLLVHLLVVDAKLRYGMQEVINHPWFKLGFNPALLESSAPVEISEDQVSAKLCVVAVMDLLSTDRQQAVTMDLRSGSIQPPLRRRWLKHGRTRHHFRTA